MFSRSITTILGALALGACASTPGAKPSDMSAAQHEQAAGAHDQMAAPHSGQYDPNATASKQVCDGKHGCWTEESNPTGDHLKDADAHKKMAADHRAASQALRDAEAKACAGLPEADRDMSPFHHKQDIMSVAPNVEPVGSSKTSAPKTTGAVVTFAAVPGLTAEWLQRVVDCHIARNNALGNDVPEMTYCPLVPKGATATVSSTGNGFAVKITSKDDKTAQEILSRAKTLK